MQCMKKGQNDEGHKSLDVNAVGLKLVVTVKNK